MTASTFSDRLASVVGRQAVAARNDPSLWPEMIERLAASLGLTVALAARGDGAKIDELLAGADAYAHVEAAGSAALAQLANLLRPPPRGEVP